MLSAKRSKASLQVDHQGHIVNVEVDKLIGYRELVIQPLGSQLASLGQFSAGSIYNAGEQVLIVDLPALLDTEQSSPVRNKQSYAGHSYRPVVLLIDSSPASRSRMQVMLESRGMSVSAHQDADSACELMRSSCPDLFIIDVEVPDLKVDTLLSQFADMYTQTAPPWIALHGYDENNLHDLALLSGASACICKPWTDEAIVHAMGSAGLRLADLTIA